MPYGPVPGYTTSTTAAPTGRSSATFVMTGCNTTFTPQATGRVLVLCTGYIGNGTTTDGMSWKIMYGTGAAPANNDAVSGTICGAVCSMASVVTSCLQVPLISQGIVTGLVPATISAKGDTVAGTTYWFDLAFSYITGGTVTPVQVVLTIIEF